MVVEGDLAEKEGGEEAERGTDDEYVQPAAGAEAEAARGQRSPPPPPPRSEPAGRAGSRRVRQRTSGGAAGSGINWG
jgi:hypothetical protein